MNVAFTLLLMKIFEQDILQVLGKAATSYSRKNLRILYDALSTLADGVGPAMGQPELLQLFMPPLVQKWQQFQDMDRELMPLMEAFTSLATALGQLPPLTTRDHPASKLLLE